MKEHVVGNLVRALHLRDLGPHGGVGLGGRRTEIPRHEMQTLGKLVPGRRGEVFAILHKGTHGLAQGVIIPGSAPHPQNGARFREQVLTGQRIERRDQGGTAQIARDPTNHDDTRIRWCAVCHTGAIHFESLFVHTCPSSGPVTRNLTCPAFKSCTTAAVTRSSSPGSMLSCRAVIRSYKVVTRRVRPGACPSQAVLSWSTAAGMILPPVLAHEWWQQNV